MRFSSTIAVVLTICVASIAHGAYTLTPLSNGLPSAETFWGETVTIDFVLESDAGDVHNSAIFQVIFTEPGLSLESYNWSAPYSNGPPFDNSTPNLADLPVLLDEDVLTGPGHPAGVTDIEFSNVLLSDTFSEGTLVSIDLFVPFEFDFLGTVFISASPDTFADGFNEIPTSGGQVFQLNVVPEPAGYLLAASGILALAYRRRRNK